MPASEKVDTHQKALSLNLDSSVFGSFAEIGAGQEVARLVFAGRRRFRHRCQNDFCLR